MKEVSLLVGNGVNVEKSLELLGDMETYNQTLNDFLDEVVGKLNDMNKYKEVGDMNNYAILVHSLKSDSKYLGFEKLAELSYNHELKSKENDVEYVNQNYAELIAEANKIVDLVKQYLGNNFSNNQSIASNSGTGKKILVVDDSNLIRNFIQNIFNDKYEVLIATDGNEAINMIDGYKDDLIGLLLDLNMPHLDGFSVLEYLSTNGLFEKIPVSIITGNDSRDNIEKAFVYPIVDMLKKPFGEHEVKHIVEKMISFYN